MLEIGTTYTFTKPYGFCKVSVCQRGAPFETPAA